MAKPNQFSFYVGWGIFFYNKQMRILYESMMRAYTMSQGLQLIQFCVPEAHLKTNNNKTKLTSSLDDYMSLQTTFPI